MTSSRCESVRSWPPDAAWAKREPFASMTRAGCEIVAVTDPDSTVRWASPSVTRLIGLETAGVLGRPGLDFVHPDDRARLADRFLDPDRGTRPSRPVGVRFRAEDGSWHCLEVIVTNRVADSDVGGVVVNARSIPESTIGEAPREGEDPFRWFASSAPIGILFADAHGNATYVNWRWLEITGMPPEDARGWCWLAATHPDDREMVMQSALAAFDSDGSSELVHRVRRPSGEIVWVHTRSSGVMGPRGTPVGYAISIEDVTAEHEMRAGTDRLFRELAGREEQFRTLVQRSSDLVAVFDDEGRFRFASPSHVRVLGYEPEQLIGVHSTDLVHPDDLDRVTSTFAAQFLDDAPPVPVWFRHRHADGHWVPLEAVASSLPRDSKVGTLVVNARDVTDRHRAESIAADQAAVLERVARAAPLHETLDAIASMVERWSSGPVAVGLVDPDDGSLHIAAAPNLSPVCVDALEGMPARPRARLSSEGPAHLRRVFVDEIANDDRYPAVRDLLLRDGIRAWAAVLIRETGTRRPLGAVLELRPEVGSPTAAEAAILEVAADLAAIAVERARAEERLAHQALHDPLTGLPNRALVVERLRYVTDRRLVSTDTAVMFLDVDRFKLLNDSLGHDAGDQLLVELGRRLRAELRPSDLVARFGGDEFVIVCDQLTGPRAARHVAQRVLEVVQQPFELGSSNVVVTASIGIAFADGTDPTSLLRDADTAMYFAKERGRARIELFDERLRTQAVERLSVEGGLRSACSLGQMVMYYQPAISLHSGDVVGFEALLRWRHPDLGLLEPERFLAVAEETGLIQSIGEWALEETCRQAMRWRAAYPEWGPLRFGVNLSAGQVADRTLSGGVERILRTTGMPADLVSFEITESVLLEDTLAAERGLLALRAHGVHLALDDFGTSYSSLAHLKRFPIQTLKIDGSFINGLLVEPDDEAIVTSVVNLARMLGLVTVAEGVEKREQADRLRVLGCDLAQGMLWAAPRPPDEVEALFAGKRAPLRISDAIN